MVRLEIQLEMIDEIVLAKEVRARGRVGVVLVFGRLFRFWLDVKLSFETNFLFVGDGQVEEFREMIQLALHVGVEQR